METLFHYCPSSTFASIISGRTIWLSSLSLSTDTMEGRLVTKTFERLLAHSQVGAEELEEIRAALSFVENFCDGLGFCLSEKPDLLSQWRGYADDGQGFAIGFTKAYLDELVQTLKNGEHSIFLAKVLYEQEEHEDALKPTYREIKELIDSGKLKKPKPVYGLQSALSGEDITQQNNEYSRLVKALWIKAMKTFLAVHKLKNNAFSEEAEWRLVSYLIKDSDDTANFRTVSNRLIPYREIKLKPLGEKVISEVYVGPKNITPNFVIEKLLALNGFPDVSIKRSSATYR